jgi:pteridine reductase
MSSEQPVALITGAARRIGAVIAETLHGAGFRVVIHCRRSEQEAQLLAARLNDRRGESAQVIAVDLSQTGKPEQLVDAAAKTWGRLDLLVNNASSFFPATAGNTTPEGWDDLIGSNLRAPFFLSQAAVPWLAGNRGAIVNIIDVHGERPLANHAVYCAAKAGLAMLTRALAKDLGPAIRVNAVAPGAILWPEREISESEKESIVAATPLQRTGSPQDVADAVVFLARSEFITGQVLAVDGGRSMA